MNFRHQMANAIRALSMDSIQKSNSGHPGMPLGMADIAEVLWNDFLNHNPTNPNWINRDRFILSNGHGSMLLYSLLHLTGYGVSIDDLKSFRQLHSKTPGHPELNETPGVETTTGPLGQGLANAVGMALAEKILEKQFNRDRYNIVDHYTYVFLGDGCLMEGISHEVCSLAGTWKLNKLIAIWDNNGISIDGKVEKWFSEDIPKRFEAYGWNVVADVDGHDSDEIKKAITKAKEESNRPTLICCNTIIGYGSPNKQNLSCCHGSPLGCPEVELARKALDWPYDPFFIPSDIYQKWDARLKGQEKEDKWNDLFDEYKVKYPELSKELIRRTIGILPDSWDEIKNQLLTDFEKPHNPIATRKASQQVLNFIAPNIPELLGGSADLTESNLTIWKGAISFSPEICDGNYIHYGVREFGMSAIMNGVALHRGFIPYGGTFLIFASYAMNAIRMAALMKQSVIFVLTHDSIGVGEDGPTHQPVEQISSLRLIPGLSVWRPADQFETAVAWSYAIENYNGPTALLLSRQELPYYKRSADQIKSISRGGYILLDCEDNPDCILIATGSEVELAIKAAEKIRTYDIKVRVVSIPSVDIFLKQDYHYREFVLPFSVTNRISIEAGSTAQWHQFVGSFGKVIGLDRFGLSAPAGQVYKELGLTVDRIVSDVVSLVKNKDE